MACVWFSHTGDSGFDIFITFWWVIQDLSHLQLWLCILMVANNRIVSPIWKWCNWRFVWLWLIVVVIWLF